MNNVLIRRTDQTTLAYQRQRDQNVLLLVI